MARLLRRLESQIKLKIEKLDGAAKRLNALSPLNVLDRGYSITTSNKTGKTVTSSQQVNKGDTVRIRLAKGQLDATVDETIE